MEKVEFKDKLVSVNRITKVVKGGRRFTFSALVVVGNYAGSVGVGYAKAKQVPDAIKKATNSAKNNLIKIPLREGRTLHHDVVAKDGAGKVLLRAAPSGTGIIAGGAIRATCEVVGIKDIVAKSMGSSNPINVLRACIKGLRSQNSPKNLANIRGKKIADVTKKANIWFNMKLNTLITNRTRYKKRLGRGIGSSKGKTSGRGHKGQKSRSGVAIKSFEGGQMPLYRRLPKRGFRSFKKKNIALINLSKLQENFTQKKILPNTKINLQNLQKTKLINSKYKKLKLLGSGEIKDKFEVEVNFISKSAKEKIEKTGGKVTLIK